MHANIEQLLELRDSGRLAANVREHVAGCARCQEELNRLGGLRSELQALPQLQPAADQWAAIQARAAEDFNAGHAGKGRGTAWPLGLAASLLVAAIVVLLLPRGADEVVPGTADVGGDLATVPATSELVAQSQRLERLLNRFSYEPRVVNARTAGTIVQLEDQIAWVDYGLTVGRERGLGPQEENALWRQRVELMNSLVHVRYAQAQRVDF
ncbi:MAG: hypothetical protein KJO85_10765 [Gammaproteobacteria bacterium]|nr:hypothetical protein [Gammaproteobacteria bacterium]